MGSVDFFVLNKREMCPDVKLIRALSEQLVKLKLQPMDMTCIPNYRMTLLWMKHLGNTSRLWLNEMHVNLFIKHFNSCAGGCAFEWTDGVLGRTL